ncbi:MAG: DUF6077 domain-containing protein [Lachnospiraceae bacterium]
MMLWIKLLLFVFLFFLTSCFTGFLLVRIGRLEEKSGFLLLVSGGICNIGVFAVLSAASALAGASLFIPGILWAALLGAAVLYVLLRYRTDFFAYGKEVCMNCMRRLKEENGELFWLLLIAVFLLIGIQLFSTALYSYHQPNATRQLKEATAAYETGVIRAGSPMMMLWAWAALLLGEHPLTVVFSMSQFVTLPLYYMGYALLAGKLCQKDRYRSLLTVLFLCILHLFGYQSGYALNITLLFSYFSGEVFVLQGCLPFLAWLTLTVLEKKPDAEMTEDWAGEEDWEEEDMKKHKIINARNLGLALLLFAVLIGGAIYILNNKINSLHEATQNLQLSMDEKCSLYEFKPENSDAAEGYLIRQSDGTLVMIGGGSAENGALLYEFLTKYGAQLDKWYLYGDTKAEQGAYEYCVGEKGMQVDRTYYLTGIEEVD